MTVVCGGREFKLSAITVSESTLVTITNIRGNKEGERGSMFSLLISEFLVLGSIALDWWLALFVKAGEEKNHS